MKIGRKLDWLSSVAPPVSNPCDEMTPNEGALAAVVTVLAVALTTRGYGEAVAPALELLRYIDYMEILEIAIRRYLREQDVVAPIFCEEQVDKIIDMINRLKENKK